MDDILIEKSICFVGDTCVGKTALLRSYMKVGEFSSFVLLPTMHDSYSTELAVNANKYWVKMHDFGGYCGNMASLKSFCNTGRVDCFVMCFATNNKSSFKNVWRRWYPELKQYNLPILLVATQCDLATSSDVIQLEKVRKMMQKVNAIDFVQCSAKNNANIDEVIMKALKAAIRGIPNRSFFDTLSKFFGFV